MLPVAAMLQRLVFLRDLVCSLLNPAHHCGRRVQSAVNLAVDGEVTAIMTTSTFLHEGTHVGEACLSWFCLWQCLELLLAVAPLDVLAILHICPVEIDSWLRLLFV